MSHLLVVAFIPEKGLVRSSDLGYELVCLTPTVESEDYSTSSKDDCKPVGNSPFDVTTGPSSTGASKATGADTKTKAGGPPAQSNAGGKK